MTDKTLNHGPGIYVFEGIDNVGKTTIIRSLKTKLEQSTEYDCVSYAFPGNESGTLGKLVYDIHHNGDEYFSAPINEISLQIMHVAAHIDLIQRKLLNQSHFSKIILMDRYWWSTYSYGLSGDIDKKMINAIIAPEMLYWDKAAVNKIYLLERKRRETVYDAEKEKDIINNYRELEKNDFRCRIVNNDLELSTAVDQIYNDILGV